MSKVFVPKCPTCHQRKIIVKESGRSVNSVSYCVLECLGCGSRFTVKGDKWAGQRIK